MHAKPTYQIRLNPDLIEEFNNSLGTEEHISGQLTFTGKYFQKKKYRGLNAWDCICSCVNRIRDTVGYLNDQILGQEIKYRSAFDFINFINNATVVIDSIDMLANILGVDLSEENSRTAAFNQVGKDGKGTDKKYFEFIRSLCAVHPIETDRHARYQNSEVVSCPFISWVRGTILETAWNCDLHANAYVNEANSWGDSICIYMDQVFAHIKYRYSLLNKIGVALEKYQQDSIAHFRNTPIPDRDPSESELEYIDRLKAVEFERFGSNNDFVYDFAKKAVAFTPSNPVNVDAALRYANAWRFALNLQLNVLRNMSRSGIEHAGIDNDDTGWILFEQLEDPYCYCDELTGFGYHLEKLSYLNGREGSNDAAWGRLKLRELEHVLRPYVKLDLNSDTDAELYMLSRIALFEIALQHDCEINSAIPQDLKYRKTVQREGYEQE